MDTAIYEALSRDFAARGVTLVAVSKTKPAADIETLYAAGQRDFGENYVQELLEKQQQLPADIRWHFIGHLQSNKVKQIAPFVHLIHAVDSFKLLQEINKQARQCSRVIDVLLQLHAAEEDSKFGLDENRLLECMEYYEAQQADLQHVRICGIMGMASNTTDLEQVRAELQRIHDVFRTIGQTYFIGKKHFRICSMGMSGDYKIAIAEGSTMVRIGSMLFGSR
jgi:pyridoxal phosphate enzyme (YggS family)